MKTKIFIVIGTILAGFILSFLYSQIVVSHPQEKFKEYRKMVYLKSNKVKLDFDLAKDAYLLKIKHIIQENQPKEIFVNGFQISPNIYHYVIRRGVIETSYIHLPKEIMKEGKNSIDISFPKNRPPDVDIILSNYRKEIGKGIYILFSDSTVLPSGSFSFKTTLLAIILIFLVFWLMSYLISRILYLTINRLFLYQAYSLLPLLFFLSCLWMYDKVNQPYKVVLTPSYFWALGLVSFFATDGGLVLKKCLQGYLGKDIEVKLKEPLIINQEVRYFVTKAVNWIKSREFSDKCILLFMTLLMMCAFLLILHLEPVAEQLANLAYLSLVTGVVIKFVKFVKEERQKP